MTLFHYNQMQEAKVNLLAYLLFAIITIHEATRTEISASFHLVHMEQMQLVQ